MYKIVRKEILNPTVTLMDIEAPLIAKKAEPGQFIILRVDENGERIPLTVAGYDREKGTVTIIFQIVGGTTELLNHKNEGDSIHDFVGPLGTPTETEGLKKVCIIGGGVGCAIALPIAKKLHEHGCEVHSIIGFRSKDLVILENEVKAASDTLHLMTDDGSYGEEGNVCVPLNKALEAGDLDRFGRLMNASHVSLEQDYEVTGLELDTLVHTAWEQDGVIGARMTGAGFGGCAIAIVNKDKVNAFTKAVGTKYEEVVGYAPAFYIAEIAGGSRVLSRNN